MRRGKWTPLILMALLPAAAPAGGILSVQSVSPQPRGIGAPANATISVRFDRALNPATVTTASIRAFGRWSGGAEGPVSLADGNTVAELTPSMPFAAGEQVLVWIANGVRGADGSSLRAGGFSFQFWVQSGRSDLTLTEAGRLTVRSDPDTRTRAYGGFATDLDNDGWADISIVNENARDVRVFLNRADGSGLFLPFLTPTNPTNTLPSPSEPGDFDADGHADVAIANTDGGAVSVLLGNGDGSFAPRQDVMLEGNPRGVAVLDFNGDGALDIASNAGTRANIALMLNDGSGVFGAPVYYGDGLGAPWGLVAADMNNDGLLDLVSGERSGLQVTTWLNAGDGTITEGPSVASGNVWMIHAGDLNGDGNEDLSVANSFFDLGSIHFGDGTGGLGPAQNYPADPFVLATDLGDLDGDGDLDWVTASFRGDWRLFANDGEGRFSFVREFVATAAASCSLMVDMNNDGRLDLALIDELADEVILLHNTPLTLFADGFESRDDGA